jgi:uncharacterized iron-regulated protein
MSGRSFVPCLARLARVLVLPVCALLASACGTTRRAEVGAPSPATAALAGARVYDARHDATVALDAMFDSLARADVVFIGEQHDNAPTHRLELAVLEALAERVRRLEGNEQA